MNRKKIITISLIIIVFLTLPFFFLSSQSRQDPKSFFQNTIPLLNQNKDQKISDEETTIYPPINPAQTNYQKVADQITNQVLEIEKDEIITDLPVRIDNFSTGTAITTTINVFTLVSDPPQSVRIEIYGPNYNNTGLLSEDAKAFKSSFEEIKKYFKSKKVNLNNLQIIYGNRQYIQDTATLWVKEFGLLN